MKANMSIDLDLDAVSVRRIENIARDSAMNLSQLITDIVKGWLYKAEDRRDPEALGLVQEELETEEKAPENCQEVFNDLLLQLHELSDEVGDLFNFYEDFGAELDDLKAEFRWMRRKFIAGRQ